jgi:hypothetical protein
MVWAEEAEPEVESIVTRVVKYWGITTFLGTPTNRSPASVECKGMIMNSSPISEAGDDASSR